MQLSKEEYARTRIHNGCLVQIESPVTQDNCSASFSRCWTVTVVTEFSIRSPQPLKILIIKKMCNVGTFNTHEYHQYETFFVHTYVTYENVIWPNLCYTQKYDICVCTFFFFFYICKWVMSFSVLLFFSEFGQMHIKMFQKLRGSDSLVFKIWTSA